MKRLTPQELIDLPGAGRAEDHLRATGRFNDALLLDGTTEYIVTVKVTGTYHPQMQTQYIDVIASTEDEALDKAEDLSDFDEIDDCEVEKITEEPK